MMKRAIFWAMILAATGANANWSTNAWPSWEWQRAGQIQAMNCYSAILERCAATINEHGIYSLYTGDEETGYRVTSISAPSAPTWWRSQRANLGNFKTTVKNLSGFYLPSNVSSNEFEGVTEDVLIENIIGVVGLCQVARLPTNYFSYTPWRCLNGLGPFTNDATVGHAHGWTNEYTAAGGTNFPAGRSTWYTTDYGWAGMSNAISTLTHTKILQYMSYVLWSMNFFSPANVGGTNNQRRLDPYSVEVMGQDNWTDLAANWGNAEWYYGNGANFNKGGGYSEQDIWGEYRTGAEIDRYCIGFNPVHETDLTGTLSLYLHWTGSAWAAFPGVDAGKLHFYQNYEFQSNVVLNTGYNVYCTDAVSAPTDNATWTAKKSWGVVKWDFDYK